MKLRNLHGYHRSFIEVLLLGSAVTTLLILFFSYRSFEADAQIEIEIAAQNIEHNFNESFYYVENIANLIGNQIVENDNTKNESVAAILRSTRPKLESESRNVFSWTFFDFINAKNCSVATSSNGVLLNPVEVNQDKRSWIVDARIRPWKLLSSKVDYGMISGEKVIPFGFGVTDKNGKFVGIISGGISVEKLRRKFDDGVAKKYITFALFDRDGSLVLTSDNFHHDIAKKLPQNFDFSALENGTIEVAGSEYFYKNTDNNSFKILVGVNRKIFMSQMWHDFFPKALNTIYLTVFSMILLYVFRKKLLTPVVDLAGVAEEISQGKLDRKVPNSEIYEVKMLAASIDKVKEFLLKEEDLKQHLKSGKEIAENANHNKTEFLSSTAHELKNMLAGIIGLSELLKLNLVEKDPQADIVEQQTREEENVAWIIDVIRLGEESLVFVNDILDVNQAQTGDFKIEEVAEVDLCDVMLRSIKLMKTRAIHERKHITSNIDKNLQRKFIASNLDPRRVKQAVVNIISNSIKYSPENTEIKINIDCLTFDEALKANKIIEDNLKNNENLTEQRRAHLLSLLQQKISAQENRFVIEIQDYGFGMNEEEIKIASKKYGTIKHDLTKKIDSTGLGLPIVKYLVEAQGGMFEISSKKGEGTKVRMVF